MEVVIDKIDLNETQSLLRKPKRQIVKFENIKNYFKEWVNKILCSVDNYLCIPEPIFLAIQVFFSIDPIKEKYFNDRIDNLRNLINSTSIQFVECSNICK